MRRYDVTACDVDSGACETRLIVADGVRAALDWTDEAINSREFFSFDVPPAAALVVEIRDDGPDEWEEDASE